MDGSYDFDVILVVLTRLQCVIQLATNAIARIAYLVGATAIVVTSNVSASPSSAGSTPRQTPASSCRATDDFASEYRDFVVGVDTGTDSESVALRQAWNIPAVQPSEIVFISDSATCTSAARAHAVQVQGDTLNPPSVWVLRVGSTRYIVFNGSRAGEYLLYFVFDAAFQYLETI